MREIVYHVAVSIDGFIARSNGSVDGFLMEGPHADAYQADLQNYDTVIMGKHTYEAGLKMGIEPGARTWPHMEHLLLSGTTELESSDAIEVVRKDATARVTALKKSDGGAIYLCGGGEVAGFLLERNLIDRIKLKINPIVIGDGIHLFGNASPIAEDAFALVDTTQYDNGVVLVEYALKG